MDTLVVLAGGGGGGGRGQRGDGGSGCARDGRSASLYSTDGGGGGGGACLGDLTENGSGSTPGRSVDAAGAGQGGQYVAGEGACAAAQGSSGRVVVSYLRER
jgi:hypothetical protein